MWNELWVVSLLLLLSLSFIGADLRYDTYLRPPDMILHQADGSSLCNASEHILRLWQMDHI